MKNITFMKQQIGIITLGVILVSSLFTACNDDIEVGKMNEQNYVIGNTSLVYISDDKGKSLFSNVEFRDKDSIALYLNAPQKPSVAASVSVQYDKSVLDRYNTTSDVAYDAFPEDRVTFNDEGIITLNAGESKSSGMKISFITDNSLSPDKSHVIPLRIKVVSGNMELTQRDETKLVFVKDLTGIPDCNKASGVKVFSCMEVNDTNPLNNLSFTLKSTGQPLVDALIIFSANINYDEKTGRVYVFNNENVQALLDNREHYLKPLQDRGMKIILGLLGNHDRSGVANLSDETAKAFAKEIKAMCDAYQLDGIFLDDEYSAYQLPAPPGFVTPSNAAAARLCYEVKKIQPERWVVVYVYGRTYSLPSVDGVQPGEFVDYALHDYGNSFDLSANFPGMPKSNMGLYSQEFARGNTSSETNLKNMRNNGYLSHMIFAMDPNRYNFQYSQKVAMERMARAFYDDELVFDGKKYPKDWK
jgi:hypothetical protein